MGLEFATLVLMATIAKAKEDGRSHSINHIDFDESIGMS
jgi:hypothetical protein